MVPRKIGNHYLFPAIWILFGLSLFSAKPARGHPMGNFSISHYSKLAVGPEAFDLLYIIDMAEIPTFQEKSWLDSDGDGAVDEAEKRQYVAKKVPELTEGLQISLNGNRIQLQRLSEHLELIPGGLSLPTLKLTLRYRMAWDAVPLRETNIVDYEDRNFPGRVGWKEIIAAGSDGVTLLKSSTQASDLSRQLTAYPEDPTIRPPQDLTASLKFSRESLLSAKYSSSLPAAAGSNLRFQQSDANMQAEQQKLARLLSTGTLSPNIISLALLVAFGLGAFHALSPGHGKTVVGAYLVGSRGTAKHAILLGAIVTVTHTLGVFLLGVVTLYASKYILPEKLYPWLGFVSGLAIAVIGLSLFRQRYRLLRAHSHAAHEHAHDGPHDHCYVHSGHEAVHAHHHPGFEHSHRHALQHPHEHSHSHAELTHTHGGVTHSHDYSNVKFRDLFTLGVTGGMVPCPSALVVLLSAISLNRVRLGLLLIVAFSFGLALVLMAIGLMMVYARGFLERFSGGGRVWQTLPILSSLLVAVVGVVIAVQSLISGGIVEIHLSAVK
jgi:nickel/cobalt transporter (NicO) family protein